MKVRPESFSRRVASVTATLAVLCGSVQAQEPGAASGGLSVEPSPAAPTGVDAAPDERADSAVIDLTRRIIGGNDAGFGQFPSIVALLDAGLFSPADRQFCGGSVIDARWVLTAAHCVHDSSGQTLDPATIRVVEQVLDLRAETVDEEVMVVNIIVHPAYDHGRVQTYDDIALLELATALDSPPAILFEQDPEAYTGERATIAGWGATEFAPPNFAVYPDTLQRASVPLVSRAACNAPDSYDFIAEGQMCAGFVEGGTDSCLGDSGGPLYIDVNGMLELIGVTSFGRGCAEPNFYGIYTSVASYLDWIDEFVTVRTLSREVVEGPIPPDGGTEPPPQTDPGSGHRVGEPVSMSGGGGSSGWITLVLLAGFAASCRLAPRRHACRYAGNELADELADGPASRARRWARSVSPS